MTRRPTLSAIAALITATLWMLISAATASATQNPDPGFGNYPIAPNPTVVTNVIHDGTPLWVFVLVAAVAMSLGITATLAWQSVHAHRTERLTTDRISARLNETSSRLGG